MKRPLYKTEIVIWSEYDGSTTEIDELARDATYGEAYCSKATSVLVPDPELDEDWDGTEFFEDAPG